MSIEIERKFLVKSDAFKKESYQINYIKQGFLNSNKKRTVRIRVTKSNGFITVKGKSNQSGTTRFEWEKEISLKEANRLLTLCEKSIIEKNRYKVKIENYTFEVDEFLGLNKGLIIAEIELANENDLFLKPKWLDKEVTGKKRYYNSKLSKLPYIKWKKKPQTI